MVVTFSEDRPLAGLFDSGDRMKVLALAGHEPPKRQRENG